MAQIAHAQCARSQVTIVYDTVRSMPSLNITTYLR